MLVSPSSYPKARSAVSIITVLLESWGARISVSSERNAKARLVNNQNPEAFLLCM